MTNSVSQEIPFLSARIERLYRLLTSECEGVDLAQLGVDAGVGGDWWLRAEQLEMRDYYRLVLLLSNEQVPDIALRLARLLSLEDLGVLGYAIWSSASLGQSLQLLMHVVERQHPYVRLRLRVEGGLAQLECQVRPAGSGYYRLLIEESLVSLWFLIQAQLPEGLAACASYVHLTFTAPPYHWRYQQAFRCRVSFQQLRAVLAFPTQWLSVAVAPGNRAAVTQTQVQRLLPHQRQDFVSQVKTLLLEHPSECAFDMVKTARYMAVSERSLRRYLAQAGSSFRALCQEVRITLAKDYLCNTDLSIQEIAYQLGYAQSNNFYRAFGSRVGVTPMEFRRNRGEVSQ
ncbi:helix-turn-helix domain-containing protein [Halioxenophilus sp. WMMB6]|uniref:helix-turn-helix domain-containing protein n=1 Tax=Halioxenophilus sp. WMMB6 TaxID=3073815 RepID=UPI00295EA448|nr:helix-turn-helix domain-containing protein [Halioxenophilus sp. WMMB6]